jgi:hypothetical protein
VNVAIATARAAASQTVGSCSVETVTCWPLRMRPRALVLEAVETLVQLQSLGYRALPAHLETLARIHLGRGSAVEAARALGVCEAILGATGQRADAILAKVVAETKAAVIASFGAEALALELQRARNLQLHDAATAALMLARDAASAPTSFGHETRALISSGANADASSTLGV